MSIKINFIHSRTQQNDVLVDADDNVNDHVDGATSIEYSPSFFLSLSISL